jgi:hypothetical protein
MIPLQSYSNPPPENKFDDLDYFEFRLDNVNQSRASFVTLSPISISFRMLFQLKTQLIIVKYSKVRPDLQENVMPLL